MLDPRSCKRLIVYGGSFDPPHRGHVELPFQAVEAAGADGVLYVPAGHPPHKISGPVAEAHHRLQMLRLALSDRHDAAISTYELETPGKGYTVDTLEHLRRELGDSVELRLLIGADMAAMFDQWHRPDRVVELAEPLVMVRRPYNLSEIAAKLGDERWVSRIVPVPAIDISSTQIRQAISQDRWDDPALTGNVHPRVLAYIRDHNLYRRLNPSFDLSDSQ